jgi:hypothetical protein
MELRGTATQLGGIGRLQTHGLVLTVTLTCTCRGDEKIEPGKRGLQSVPHRGRLSFFSTISD